MLLTAVRVLASRMLEMIGELDDDLAVFARAHGALVADAVEVRGRPVAARAIRGEDGFMPAMGVFADRVLARGRQACRGALVVFAIESLREAERRLLARAHVAARRHSATACARLHTRTPPIQRRWVRPSAPGPARARTPIPRATIAPRPNETRAKPRHLGSRASANGVAPIATAQKNACVMARRSCMCPAGVTTAGAARPGA